MKIFKNNKAISIRTGSIYKADDKSDNDKSVALTAMDVMTTDSNEKKYQALLDYCNDYTDFVHEASETKDYDELKAMLLDCDPIIQGNDFNFTPSDISIVGLTKNITLKFEFRRI